MKNIFSNKLLFVVMALSAIVAWAMGFDLMEIFSSSVSGMAIAHGGAMIPHQDDAIGYSGNQDDLNIVVGGGGALSAIKALIASNNNGLGYQVSADTNLPLNETFLSSSVKLSEDTPTYTFDFRDTVSGAGAQDRKLEENKDFFVTGMLLYFIKENLDSVGNDTSAIASHGSNRTGMPCRKIFCSPDPTYFGHIDDEGNKEYRALQAFFNSVARFSVSGNTSIPDFPMLKLQKETCCQFRFENKEVVIGPPAAEGDAPETEERLVPVFPEFDINSAFYEFEQGFTLQGNEANSLTIELKEGSKKAIMGMYDECGIPTCNRVGIMFCGRELNRNVISNLAGFTSCPAGNGIATFGIK